MLCVPVNINPIKKGMLFIDLHDHLTMQTLKCVGFEHNSIQERDPVGTTPERSY